MINLKPLLVAVRHAQKKLGLAARRVAEQVQVDLFSTVEG